MLAAALPGAVAFLLPPLITAVTGLVVIPLLFRWMARSLVAERGLLGGDAVA